MNNKQLKIWSPVAISLILILALTACGQAGQSNDAPAGGGVVKGNVLYLSPAPLDPNATIEVDLLQTSPGNPDIVLATAGTYASGRQVPIPFEIPFDPAQIDPAQTYMVAARIMVNGQAV